MQNIDDILLLIKEELLNNKKSELILFTTDGENVKQLTVSKINDTIHTSTGKYKNPNDASNIFFNLQLKSLEVEKLFNQLDFDVDYARKIHPNYDINWEHNLETLTPALSIERESYLFKIPNETTIEALKADPEEKSFESFEDVIKTLD